MKHTTAAALSSAEIIAIDLSVAEFLMQMEIAGPDRGRIGHRADEHAARFQLRCDVLQKAHGALLTREALLEEKSGLFPGFLQDAIGDVLRRGRGTSSSHRTCSLGPKSRGSSSMI